MIKRIKKYFDNNPVAYKRLFTGLAALFLVFAIYFITVISFLPVLNYNYNVPEKKTAGRYGLVHDLSWHYLVHDSLQERSVKLASKEAFILARLEMAKKDSIGLTIDLNDSIITLDIKGITIFSTRIKEYSCSNLFTSNDPFVTAQYFSWPFVVENYSASVPKIPVIVRKAPKDTIEAASQPETGQMEESQSYISFQLQLDRKLNLLFEQDKGPDSIKFRKIRHYIRQQKKEVRRAARITLIRGSPAEFRPEIKIRLDHADALVIFRALPEKAGVAIRIDPESRIRNM